MLRIYSPQVAQLPSPLCRRQIASWTLEPLEPASTTATRAPHCLIFAPVRNAAAIFRAGVPSQQLRHCEPQPMPLCPPLSHEGLTCDPSTGQCVADYRTCDDDNKCTRACCFRRAGGGRGTPDERFDRHPRHADLVLPRHLLLQRTFATHSPPPVNTLPFPARPLATASCSWGRATPVSCQFDCFCRTAARGSGLMLSTLLSTLTPQSLATAATPPIQRWSTAPARTATCAPGSAAATVDHGGHAKRRA